jgi:hypothetical protein
MKINLEHFRVRSGATLKLKDWPTRAKSGHKRENNKNFTEPDKHEVQLSESFTR